MNFAKTVKIDCIANQVYAKWSRNICATYLECQGHEMDELQGSLTNQNDHDHGLDFDPTKIRNDDNNDEPSEVESEQEKEALSQEELQYIVDNSKYRDILSDLLTPFVEGISENGSVHSADHTVTDNQSEKCANPVVYKLANRQEEGADTSSFTAKTRALKQPSDGELKSF